MRAARLLTLAACCATLAGCGRREAHRAGGVDTTRVAADSGATAGYAADMILNARAGARSDPALVAQVRGALAPWAAAWRYQDPSFRLDSLRWHGPDTCRIEYTTPLSEAWFDTPEQRRFGWRPSPDGTRALVTNAYREWDPHSGRWAYEPDALTALVDQIGARWARVMECGTPCRFDAGAWLDRDRFVVAGLLTDGMPQMIAPQVWIYDLARGVVWSAVGPMVPVAGSRYDDAIDSLTARALRGPA